MIKFGAKVSVITTSDYVSCKAGIHIKPLTWLNLEYSMCFYCSQVAALLFSMFCISEIEELLALSFSMFCISEIEELLVSSYFMA